VDDAELEVPQELPSLRQAAALSFTKDPLTPTGSLQSRPHQERSTGASKNCIRSLMQMDIQVSSII